MRRGSAAVAEPQPVADTRDVDLTRASEDLCRALDDLDIANARADRAERQRDHAREAILDTAAEVAALNAAALPQLADLHPGFDEPFPEDGEWSRVDGDRASDWPPVEPVDFGPVYALIGAAELAGAAV